MKKLTVFLVLSSLFILLAGCGSGSDQGSSDSNSKSSQSDQSTQKKEKSGEKVTLSVWSDITDQGAKEAYQSIVDDFTKSHPNIQVETNFPGAKYENLLKVKMAANKMPDVFDTHGWAKVRYGKYLADLRDESWVKDLSPTIKPFLTDMSGKVYALPLNQSKSGITYNVDILKKYNIPVPKTFDELEQAAITIKKESNGKIEPFYFFGHDNWTFGQFFDYFATPLLISSKNNDQQALTNHSFDWSKWTYLPQKFKELQTKGLMNKDVLTARYSDAPKAFAQGKFVFSFYPPDLIAQAKKMNPDLHVGLMPIPAIQPGDQPTFVGGERYTMGAWKDSKHLQDAKALLSYFSQPENVKKMSEVTALPPGLKNAKVQNMFSSDYEKYKSDRVFSFFDRVYLPNGMWDVMCQNAAQLLAGQISPSEYSQHMKEQYERLNKQSQ